jgi:hypothetical protein
MTRAKEIGLGRGLVVLILVVIILRVWGIEVDDIPPVFPDCLETAL